MGRLCPVTALSTPVSQTNTVWAVIGTISRVAFLVQRAQSWRRAGQDGRRSRGKEDNTDTLRRVSQGDRSTLSKMVARCSWVNRMFTVSTSRRVVAWWCENGVIVARLRLKYCSTVVLASHSRIRMMAAWTKRVGSRYTLCHDERHEQLDPGEPADRPPARTTLAGMVQGLAGVCRRYGWVTWLPAFRAGR